MKIVVMMVSFSVPTVRVLVALPMIPPVSHIFSQGVGTSALTASNDASLMIRTVANDVDGESRDQYQRDDRSLSPRRRDSPPRRERNRSASPGGRLGDRSVPSNIK